ncbi:hypothetical protein [Desertivirga arenae]|uniref:hypothetical protein n=1 Tax=Desertivirga arenae TaxID=2810309 RepID=UPI001A962BAC|nr:hypothetical protein [Pedobacter sp. SYSU D00823]
MKKLLLPVFAISALLLGSCSTQKIAQQQSNEDDVYFTEAKAKEVTFAVREERREEKSYRTDEQLYGGGNYADDRYDNSYYDDYNYDYGYASRLNRFYGRSPWRSNYYDSWYAYSYNPWYTYRYDPFFYDPWYYRGGISLSLGFGAYPRWGGYGYYDNFYMGYYGAPYASNYWGPYSYYNVYPGYVYNRRSNPNYGPRPTRGGSDVYRSSGRGTIITGGQPRSSTNGNGRTSSSGEEPSYRRPRPSGPDYNTQRERQPSTSSTRETQPQTRTERPAPVERSAPAPSSYGGGNSSSGGGNNSGSRPSRGGN